MSKKVGLEEEEEEDDEVEEEEEEEEEFHIDDTLAYNTMWLEIFWGKCWRSHELL